MSKITNDGLTQDALHCTHMTTMGIKGLTKSVITKFIERLIVTTARVGVVKRTVVYTSLKD